ncbi:MAG TPA: DMT family transporter [bacterium]|nr:DMT family transporter [bacterium]
MGTTRPPRRSTGTDLVALLVVSIWGMSFPFQKVALLQFGPSGFMCLRYLGMLALSWGVFFALRKRGDPIGMAKSDLPALALAGVLGYSLYIPLSTFGLAYTTPFANALLIALAPLFANALLRRLRLETIGRAQYAGMLVALAGAFVFVLPALRLRADQNWIGDLLSLAGAAFFAGYTVASKPLLPRYRLPAMMAYTLTIGTVPLVAALLPSVWGLRWNAITPAGWAAFAWTVVAPVYAAWTLWNWTIARMGVARASVFMYLVPVVGGVTSWLLFGEGFGVLKVAGAALVLAGLVVARRRPAPGGSAQTGHLVPRFAEP